MTRAVFNTTCDVYSGPGSATPGILVGTFACRLVSNAAILLVGADAPERLWYLTVQDYTPVGAWASPMISLDASLADLIAVPSGTDPRFLTLFTEAIDWQGQAVYQRANLVEMPEDFWAGYGLVAGPVDELLDVGLVVGEIDDEEEEEDPPPGEGASCESAEALPLGGPYGPVILNDTDEHWLDVAVGCTWVDITISSNVGSSFLQVWVYGGDCETLGVLAGISADVGGPHGCPVPSGATKIHMHLTVPDPGNTIEFSATPS